MADEDEHGGISRKIKKDVDVTKARARKLADTAEWVFGGRAARVLGVVALFVVVVALLLVFLTWYVAPTKPSEKKDLVLAVAQILAGTALLSGLYLTWRTLQINREGQITERFTRAIDQLGSKELELRLGGIYALERIARDSEQDHWPIMEVLTAYVRQHAPSRQEGGVKRYFHAWEEYKQYRSEEKKSGEYLRSEVPAPPPEVRAIMTVLRRRTRSYGHGESEHLNLKETNHSGGNLFRADLSGAYLRGANFSEAYLRGADLREADLWEAYLREADLSGAYLQKARGMTHDQLESAMGSKETRLPEGLERPEWWRNSIEEQKNIIRERLSG